MISKDILNQYVNLQEEIKEVQEKIEKLELRIAQIEQRIKEIENGETVKDKVLGGLGGLQSFNIEGVPMKEYRKRKTDLLSKKLLLHKRKSMLEQLEFDLLQTTNEVEAFIADIPDSRMRRIVNLRFIKGLSWGKVADCIGGGNTDETVRKAFYRFMEKN